MKKAILFFSFAALTSCFALSAKEAAPEQPQEKAPETLVAKAVKKSSPGAPSATKPSVKTPSAQPSESAPETAEAKSPDKKAPSSEKIPEANAVVAEGKTPDAVSEKVGEDSSPAPDPAPDGKMIATSSAVPSTNAAPMDITKISEAFGHVIGKNLENIGVKFDIAKVIKGLQDSMEGRDSPMSEMECIRAIAAAQEQVFKKQSAENLKRAEAFLATNAKTNGIVALEEGKVQYKITEPGQGASVESHFSPLIKYCGHYLDGSVFGSSKEEETISLDEIIPGLKAGLLGMREGEKRTVYIHPDLAYGTNGLLPPNSLLTFEVEMIKANAPIVKESSEAKAPSAQPQQEIADIKTDIR